MSEEIKNPWRSVSDESSAWTCVEDRMRVMMGYDEQRLREALAWPNTQKTVKAAIERRLRAMERLGMVDKK